MNINCYKLCNKYHIEFNDNSTNGNNMNLHSLTLFLVRKIIMFYEFYGLVVKHNNYELIIFSQLEC